MARKAPKAPPRDIVAVMLDLLELADGVVDGDLITEGHAAVAAHLREHGNEIVRGEEQLLEMIAVVLRDPNLPEVRRKAWVDVAKIARRAAKARKPATRRPVGRPAEVDVIKIRALRGPDDAPLHTMREVAVLIGCSVSTVSEALKRDG